MSANNRDASPGFQEAGLQNVLQKYTGSRGGIRNLESGKEKNWKVAGISWDALEFPGTEPFPNALKESPAKARQEQGFSESGPTFGHYELRGAAK